MAPLRQGEISMTLTLHATLVFEREISAAPKAVFAALVDPAARVHTIGTNASLDSLVRYFHQ
jgi:hypothetical protein